MEIRLEVSMKDSGLLHDSQGAHAKHRHIEPVVLAGFDGFNKRELIGLKATCSTKHTVSSFERFHRNHRSLADNDTLTNM